MNNIIDIKKGLKCIYIITKDQMKYVPADYYLVIDKVDKDDIPYGCTLAYEFSASFDLNQKKNYWIENNLLSNLATYKDLYLTFLKKSNDFKKGLEALDLFIEMRKTVAFVCCCDENHEYCNTFILGNYLKKLGYRIVDKTYYTPLLSRNYR